MIEILIGILAGVITSIGMGGGAILILLATVFLNFDQKSAQGFNLIFFIPTAIISIIIYIKNKQINLKLSSIVSFFGIIGAFIGAKISLFIQTNSLRKYFSIFLIVIVFYEIYSFYREYINKRKKA